MKRFGGILLLYIFVYFFVAYGQVPVSFRSQALGGIVNDDLDLVYDPIELHFVPGIRLYTNLSNLTSGREQVLNDISDNEFLGGVSWKYPIRIPLNGAILVRYQNAYFADTVFIDQELDGYTDMMGNGDVRNAFSGYYDTNNDGLYDLRKAVVQRKYNFSRQKHTAFVINHSANLAGMVLGFRIAADYRESETPRASTILGSRQGVLLGAAPADPSFSLNYGDFSIPEDFQQFRWTESGDFSSNTTAQTMDLHLSAMKPIAFWKWDTTEVRLDINYFKQKESEESRDSYRGEYAYFEREIQDYRNSYNENENWDALRETSGSGMGFGVAVKRVFQRASERKNDGFWELLASYGTASFDYTYRYANPFSSEENYFDGADTLSTDYETTLESHSSSSDAGDETHRQYLMMGRMNLPLGERVFLGMGFRWQRFSLERTTLAQYGFTLEKNHQTLDNVLADDFQRTESFSRQADHIFRYWETIFQIPVGIEYAFTKNRKWYLRFGSVFTYRKTVQDDAYQVTQAKPYVTTVRYGDGTETVEVDDNVYQSTSQRTENSRSETRFFYGLGYYPTDYLQIDLVSFLGTNDDITSFNPAFFRSLRLSFVVKL